MNKLTNGLGACAALAIMTSGTLLAGAANAAVVTVPSFVNSTTVSPFGNAGSTIRYQQVYEMPSLGAAPVEITGLTFFAPAQFCVVPGFCFTNPGDSIATGNYTISLSTTSKTADNLSTSLAANRGADNAVFFSGDLSDTLTIGADTPFFYDGSLGNLLLDITINSQTPNDTFFASAELFTDAVNSLASSNGTTGTISNRSTGLRTQFTYEPFVAQVSEPGTFALLGAGLLAIGGVARRKRSERSSPQLDS